MGTHGEAVVGRFRTRGEVDIAVAELKGSGFRNSDISVRLAEGDGASLPVLEPETEHDATVAIEGGVLLWIHVDDLHWRARATSIITHVGASEVSTRDEPVQGAGQDVGPHMADHDVATSIPRATSIPTRSNT